MPIYHFKQENLSFVLDIIQKNDYLTSIDLTDAYFSISINNEFKFFLRFSWKTVFLLASLIPLGMAVSKTGTALWIAQETVKVVSDMAPWIIGEFNVCKQD
jgi:hypothetical protein